MSMRRNAQSWAGSFSQQLAGTPTAGGGQLLPGQAQGCSPCSLGSLPGQSHYTRPRPSCASPQEENKRDMDMGTTQDLRHQAQGGPGPAHGAHGQAWGSALPFPQPVKEECPFPLAPGAPPWRPGRGRGCRGLCSRPNSSLWSSLPRTRQPHLLAASRTGLILSLVSSEMQKLPVASVFLYQISHT